MTSHIFSSRLFLSIPSALLHSLLITVPLHSVLVATFLQEMVSAAETHHTSKLLVDLSGNPGGFVDFAYLFVRALHPMLPLGHLVKDWTVKARVVDSPKPC